MRARILYTNKRRFIEKPIDNIKKRATKLHLAEDKANFVNVLEQLVYFAEQCFFGFQLCEFLLGQTCSGAQVSAQYRIHIVSHAIVQFSFIHDNLHLRMAI